jgi:hypothetical protein
MARIKGARQLLQVLKEAIWGALFNMADRPAGSFSKIDVAVPTPPLLCKLKKADMFQSTSPQSFPIE